MRYCVENTIAGLIIGVLFCFITCKRIAPPKPIPMQDLSNIFMPFHRLAFKAIDKNWEATLLTFSQPIRLEVEYNETGFNIFPEHEMGIIEGPGQICLKSGSTRFFYKVWFTNQESQIPKIIDNRSPKTVNPDSSLNQQKIVFAIDEWCNLANLIRTNEFFEEEEVFLTTVAGVYFTQQENPLSAYNIQAGSCTIIPISVNFRELDNRLVALAGPLKDRFDNLVSDGTMVTFIYGDGQYSYRKEAILINGLAQVEIPTESSKAYYFFAQVNSTRSATLQLNTF